MHIVNLQRTVHVSNAGVTVTAVPSIPDLQSFSPKIDFTSKMCENVKREAPPVIIRADRRQDPNADHLPAAYSFGIKALRMKLSARRRRYQSFCLIYNNL